MPLTMLGTGESARVVNISAANSVRLRLADMGLIAGTAVRLISRNSGGVLVGINESRLMIQYGLAQQVQVG